MLSRVSRGGVRGLQKSAFSTAAPAAPAAPAFTKVGIIFDRRGRWPALA